ncbi:MULTISPECIES: amino acid ABC transporter substrate-binding protein [Halomonadaceae]|uniref:amino acid ABC transporter substrate-binding protein n=1 Tax=Halomonadaceae TaxID=28256 RepID=UPI00159AC3F0|nr:MULTISPECIES: amino acid ABC transporter substrate-binding protein [Halomonas]QJQ94152.1 amino acid ABC transporter substrate-binding protein [Halomonas sp. PA5]
MTLPRHFTRAALGLCVAVSLAASPLWAGEVPETIRIGYAVSDTGPYAGGAGTTITPNYKLWVHEVNEAGGIRIGDRQVPIEVVAYDDRSSSEEAVRAVERLINQDEVHFVLPPWGTALNLAVAPVLHRAGYPHLAVTAVSNHQENLMSRWPRIFFFLSMSSHYAEGIVDMLTELRDSGEIEGRVAMVNVADQFGIELANAARERLDAAGFEVVYNQAYPPGTQDMQSIINSARQRDPEAFLAFSYPPETIAITDQAQTLGFNPPLFYTAVGTAFPLYKSRFGDNVEGVIGIGGVESDSEAMMQYIERHTEVIGQAPDLWASAPTYASLQVLQQAIERAGSIDHETVVAEMENGTFETVLGEITLDGRVYWEGWQVGQWQDGMFRAIAPMDRDGASELLLPKPDWR